MWTIRRFVTRHPMLTYFALTFVLSWAAVILVLGGVPGPKTKSDDLLPFAILAMFVGPSVAGIVLIGLL
jgi:CAAX protease family protein